MRFLCVCMLFLTRHVAFFFNTICINIPEDAILVTVDIEGLYLSVPHELGLKHWKKLSAKKNLNQCPRRILSKWLNFYFKITIMNLMEKLNSKFLELL